MEYLSVVPTEKKEYYQLSSAQKRLYIIQSIHPESLAYNLNDIISLKAEISIEAIEEINNRIINHHEILRTSFIKINGVPYQKIHDNYYLKIESIEIEDNNINEITKRFSKPFDLTKLPLIRIYYLKRKKLSSLLFVDYHHIIFDASSTYLFYKEFDKLFKKGSLKKLKVQYNDYSEWQNKIISLNLMKKNKDFWLNKFKTEPVRLNLCADFERTKYKSYDGAAIEFVLNENRTTALKAVSQAFDVSLFTTVLTLFNLFLSKLSNENDIVIGVPVQGRNNYPLQDMMGMFVNTLPIRSIIDYDKTFIEVLLEIRKDSLLALENQDYQFNDLISDLSFERDPSREPLFDVMLDFLNQHKYNLKLDYLDDHSNYNVPRQISSQFDITLKVIELKGNLLFIFEYCTTLYKNETINRFIEYFKNIVDSIKGNINIKVKDIDILSLSEKEKLLYEFNDTKAEYPRGKTIQYLFEEQASLTPTHSAVICDGEVVSYQELEVKATQLACYISKHVGANCLIGIMSTRSISMVVGILGVLKSGNFYLPIDPEQPINRNKRILEESQTKHVLVDKLEFHLEGIDVINLLDENMYCSTSIVNLPKTIGNDLAYVIYTSGSTGVPKGVMVSHNNLVNFVTGMMKLIPKDELGTVLSLTTISFDIFGLELFVPLIKGSAMVLVKEDSRFDVKKLGSIIDSHEVSVMQLTPSRLSLILYDDYSEVLLKKINILLIGGEELPPTLLFKLRDIYKGKIYNMYGPTETTIWSTYKDISGDLSLNIGRPIINTGIYILDKTGRLQPIGVSGELCIGGEGVSIGYFNNKKLTKEKFIDNPFKEGDRLYRTGDLARWLPDGNIEFLGRIDHQIKIRGFRIELGEIENTISNYINVKECVVKAIGESGDNYLCAYIVCEEELNREEIRNYLSKQLPDYMVPSYFVELEELPLTVNGKIDRKALPKPEIKRKNFIPPEGEMENKLVGIWQDVLNLNPIDVTDNFFEIGGHSLNAIKITSLIFKEFNVEIRLGDFFENSTIRKVSKLIELLQKKEDQKGDILNEEVEVLIY